MPRTKNRPTVAQPLLEHDLARAIAAELAVSLAALRAALEGVTQEAGVDPACRERVVLAIEQTFPIARQIEALADCAADACERCAPCTPREIACSTRKALTPRQGARLAFALEDDAATFHVDGPLLVRTLALLAECVLARTEEQVLLRVSRHGDALAFSLLWSSDGLECEDLGLRRRLLRREARRLGAELSESLDARGCARVELAFHAANDAEVRA